MVELYDVINQVGNRNANESRDKLTEQGYKKDLELSNRDNQIYYNKDKNDVIYNVRGSNRFSDIGTNLSLITGNLKNTKRYMSTHKGIRDAKKKYNVDGINIVGNSLGSSIASNAGSKNDKITTYNKFSAPFQKTRSNETSYRTGSDIASIFNAGNGKTKTLKNKNKILPSLAANLLKAHSAENIKNKNISI
jgi:hypothetical protein